MGRKFRLSMTLMWRSFFYRHVHDFGPVVDNLVRSHGLVYQVLQQEVSVVSFHVVTDGFKVFMLTRK